MNQLLKENCSLVREQHQNIKVGNIMISKYDFFPIYILIDFSDSKVSLGEIFLLGEEVSWERLKAFGDVRAFSGFSSDF